MYPFDHFSAMFASYFSWTIYWASQILIFSYMTVYVFVPRYLYKKKYVSFCFSLLLLYAVMYTVNALQLYYQLNKTFNFVAGVRSQDLF